MNGHTFDKEEDKNKEISSDIRRRMGFEIALEVVERQSRVHDNRGYLARVT